MDNNGNTIDEKDMKILEILRRDGRKSYTEIAKILDTSESSVRKRIKRMEEEGIIKGYRVEIDPPKIGYNVITFTGFDTNPEDFLSVAKKLCEFEEVKRVWTSTGDHMIMTEIWAKDGKELCEILFDKLGKIKGVRRICPTIILEQWK